MNSNFQLSHIWLGRRRAEFHLPYQCHPGHLWALRLLFATELRISKDIQAFQPFACLGYNDLIFKTKQYLPIQNIDPPVFS